MNFIKTALVAATVAGAGALIVPHQANAMPADAGLTVSSAVESVACRVTRARVIGPGGRVTFRTSRVCTPDRAMGMGRGCTVERQRVVRPNGSVVFKQIRRCR